MLRAFGHCVATCWVLLAQVWNWSNLSQQHPTCRSKVAKRTQHVNAQHGCNMLCWHVAIVWPGLYRKNVPIVLLYLYYCVAKVFCSRMNCRFTVFCLRKSCSTCINLLNPIFRTPSSHPPSWIRWKCPKCVLYWWQIGQRRSLNRDKSEWD